MHYSRLPMHIPDGFLSVPVAIVMWAVAIGVIILALRRSGRELGERQVPLMGVLAACIFAGQMLNFSVTGGTSGHLLGAALAVILLGPWGAILVLTAVVGVQALIFQDGGLLALGANLFNMGLIGVSVAYFTYRTITKLAGGRRWGMFVGSFAAGWLSIFVASLAAALELAISGTSPANIAVPAMGGIHALIGVGEGLITTGAVAFLFASRRELLEQGKAAISGGRLVWGAGIAIAVILAVLSPLASAHPDGLEWVAEQQGFLSAARGPVFEIIPDYVLPGIQSEAVATILAGIVGVGLVLLVVAGVALARRRRPATAAR